MKILGQFSVQINIYMSAFPHFWAHRGDENERAITLLSSAMEKDRGDMRAQSLRAWAYAQQATYMWSETPLISRENAQRDAEAAALSAGDHAPSLVAIAAAFGMTGLDCAFRSIRPVIPITSGHLNRGIRPPLFSGCEA